MVVDGDRLDLSEELLFHGIEYIISLNVAEGPVLVVDVEQVFNAIVLSLLTWLILRDSAER